MLRGERGQTSLAKAHALHCMAKDNKQKCRKHTITLVGPGLFTLNRAHQARNEASGLLQFGNRQTADKQGFYSIYSCALALFEA
jgi:hypothetical protein